MKVWMCVSTWICKVIIALGRSRVTLLVYMYTEDKEERYIHVRYCEETFGRIKENAERIGMRLNAQKTQLLCMAKIIFLCKHSRPQGAICPAHFIRPLPFHYFIFTCNRRFSV